MDVRPLIVHVLDAVFSLVVLHAGPRQFAAAPVRLAAAVVLARRRLAEDAPIVFRIDPIGLAAAGMLGRLPDRDPVGFEFGKPRPKPGVDIPLQNLGGGHDMRVGIVDPEPVPHRLPPGVRFCTKETIRF